MFDGMSAALALGADSAKENALELFEAEAPGILEYAQANAPWEDRTGDARAGLGVEVYEEDGDIYLDLYHTVDYGLWLEVIQNGRFATIMPTLEAYADRLIGGAGGQVLSAEGEDY
jgi:hypothetical protein